MHFLFLSHSKIHFQIRIMQLCFEFDKYKKLLQIHTRFYLIKFFIFYLWRPDCGTREDGEE